MVQSDASWESTLSLLTRAREGDEQALNDLFARYLPPLRRWASGRLPRWARDLADTPDLVQDTLFHVFRKVETFEHRGEGAFQAYLRQALMNRIRNELRNSRWRPERAALDESLPDPGSRRSRLRSVPKQSSVTRLRCNACAPRSASWSSRASSWV